MYIIICILSYIYKGGAGCVSVAEKVVTFDNVSFVNFNGFTIDCAKVMAVMATDGESYPSIHPSIYIYMWCFY